MMTVIEIKPEPRNKDAIELLRGVTKVVEENPLASEVLILVSIDGEYHRHSTGISDGFQMVAMLEVAKHDLLQRMYVGE